MGSVMALIQPVICPIIMGSGGASGMSVVMVSDMEGSGDFGHG